MTATRKPRSPEYIERKRVREAERRRVAREALGFKSAEEFRKFASDQVRKMQSDRIQPSLSKRQKMAAAVRPGQTFEDWKAGGGVVEVVPSLIGNNPGPPPARHYVGTGSRAQ